MKMSIKGKDYFSELEQHLNSLACSYISNVISIEVLLEKLIEKGVLSQEEVTAIKLETGKRYNEAVEKMIAEQKTEKKTN